MKRSWLLLAAAALPCVALLTFAVLGLQEWWLIKTRQIAVVPAPQPGQTAVDALPPSLILPWVVGSLLLAATFAYAMLKNSKKALAGGYAVIILVVGAAYVRNTL